MHGNKHKWTARLTPLSTACELRVLQGSVKYELPL